MKLTMSMDANGELTGQVVLALAWGSGKDDDDGSVRDGQHRLLTWTRH